MIQLWRTLLCAGFLTVRIAAINQTTPNSVFQSRPDIQAPIMDVTLNVKNLATPGYLFTGPYDNLQPGPYIYDNSGNLVWSGHGAIPGVDAAHDFRVCDYNGSIGNHLSFVGVGSSESYGYIMDSSFNVVTSKTTGIGSIKLDMHEFNVLPGGKTVIVTIYQPIPYDLTAYGVAQNPAWLLVNIFQEIDILTGKVLFTWNCTDHVKLSESYVLPGTLLVSGDGKTEKSAWDYFHLNSIDKDVEGNYIISSRHCCAIYKISKVNGSRIWNLGGTESTIKQDGFNFSYQHDARVHSTNETITVISFFNNAGTAFSHMSNTSSGMLVSVNNNTGNAFLVQQYDPPGTYLLSETQGSLQILNSTNVLIGFGNIPDVAEYLSNGTAIWAGNIGFTSIETYRWYKCNFSSTPTTRPTIKSYARTNTSNTAIYVSWNGATAVAKWTFYASNSSTNNTSAFKSLGTLDNKGFETLFFSSAGFDAYAFVEAQAANGSSLANSSIAQTFVPSKELLPSCGDTSCVCADASSDCDSPD